MMVRPRKLRRLLAVALAALCVIGPDARADEPSAEAIEQFETQVRPLLVARCQKCHGTSNSKGGLSLTSRAGFNKGGDSGPVVIAGKPDESPLIAAVRYNGDGPRMPPDGKLPEADIARLVHWVEQGAVWPADAVPGNDGASSDSAKAGPSALWSLQPVRDLPPPEVHASSWPRTSVDRFILAALEQKQLKPAAPAAKHVLLRRITFDLTGLPPTPEETQAFIADDSPDAFETVVDRLLASPRYGERWARHWLDVVRYADARDLIQLPVDSDFREAWRYRDWVVDALNRDLPYDEFVRRQIAGDLMQPADPAQIDAEALVATGMLAIADFVPGDVDKQQMIADYVNDQIDVLGRAILGMTLACARCHDHKFDPVTTEDYYALAGIFFSTRLVPGPVAGNTPLVRVPLLPAAQLQEIADTAERDKQRIAQITLELAGAVDREFLAHLERQAQTQARHDLRIALEFKAAAGDPNRPALAEFAAGRKIEPGVLQRWLSLFDRPEPLAVLKTLLAAPDADVRAALLETLQAQWDEIAARRKSSAENPVVRLLVDSEILRFRADDLQISVNETGQVIHWPDRAAVPQDAGPLAGAAGPARTSAVVGGQPRPVVRFDGSAVLQAARSVPAVGTLLAVFRPDPALRGGARLVGWEDSAVGQHGLGLMPDAAGGLHAVLRRAGANGDVVLSAPAENDFQLISLTWGPEGVALYRNGQAAGSNKGIDSVSSDPAITALMIGGPGSGGSPRFQGDLCELRIYAAPLDDAARTHVEAELRQRWFDPPPDAPQAGDPAEELFAELLSSQSPYWIAEADRPARLAPDFQQRQSVLRSELETLQKKPAVEIPRAVVVQEGGPPGTKHEGFQDAKVYIRGNPANPGKTVPRGFPHALLRGTPPQIEQGSGRRELARWLAGPDNPLTARVMVNRIWQHHFGEGLVRTSTNFGVRGELPSHPELLDHLASRFIESGWSVKGLHRLIVLSSVYRQGSQADPAVLAADPENRLLARMPRRRLEAEAIRDALLAVSGKLDVSPGGPGFLDAAIPRRTLYLMSVRTGSKTADFNPLFDGPDGGGIIERRNQSIVAPQALFLLNDLLLDDVSQALAARAAREFESPRVDDRIRRTYEILFARSPTSLEREIGLSLLSGGGTIAETDDAWTRYARLLLCTNEFLYVD